jgi:hypothetical protein
MRIPVPPSARGRRSRDGDVGGGFLLVVVARDVAGPSSSPSSLMDAASSW